LQPSEPTFPSVCIELPARLDNLPHFITSVLTAARTLPLAEGRCDDLELALEESLVNICNYAYPGREGTVRISWRTEGDCFVVSIEDEGMAFSLVDAAVPDTTAELSARKIGGLGVHLVRSLMDDVRYCRDADRNLLELTLFFAGERGKE
jgi:serine/threonine-protein kinase RsbW